jgi:hypothetical protein
LPNRGRYPHYKPSALRGTRDFSVCVTGGSSTIGAISQRDYAKGNRTVGLAVTDIGGGRMEIQMNLRVK